MSIVPDGREPLSQDWLHDNDLECWQENDDRLNAPGGGNDLQMALRDRQKPGRRVRRRGGTCGAIRHATGWVAGCGWFYEILWDDGSVHVLEDRYFDLIDTPGQCQTASAHGDIA